MDKRHDAIGIKQAIRFEWMQKTANLLLAGLDAKTIRNELHEFLADRKGNGTEAKRGQTSRAQVVTMLMRIWVSPAAELLGFRDASIAFLREKPAVALAIHWGMISAVYPFWFNVARQTGRLLALQNQATQAQIINRLKEQYGDRQTVIRYARFVIRSFVAWGVLKDSDAKGCYQKANPVDVADANQAILILESALLATAQTKGSLVALLSNPAFFPFRLPVLPGDLVPRFSDRIDVVRFGLDEVTLLLKQKSSPARRTHD